VAKESEQVLEQHGISAAAGQKESSVKVTIGQYHGNGSGQHGHRKQQ
jgi:hypothetical protein